LRFYITFEQYLDFKGLQASASRGLGPLQRDIEAEEKNSVQTIFFADNNEDIYVSLLQSPFY